MVSKAICCRVNIEKLRLSVPASAAAWERQLLRIGQRNFQPHHLHLMGGGSAETPRSLLPSDAWSLLQLRPLLQNLHTLRVHDLDVPEAAVEQLVRSTPYLQQLFLGSVEAAAAKAHGSSIDLLTCHQIKQAAVTAVVPAEGSKQCALLCCTVTTNRSPQLKDAERRIARVLSQFQCLHTLRLDCPLAQGVLLHLCELWGGSADAEQVSSDIRGPSVQPQVVHIPSLGWYLFRAIGSSRAPAAGIQNSSSSSSSASVAHRHDSMPRPADLDTQPGNCDSLIATEGDHITASSTSCRPYSPAVSCPGDVEGPEDYQTSAAVVQPADVVAQLQLEQQCQEQRDEGLDAAGSMSAMSSCTDSLARSSSIGRHSLDLQRCLAALADDAGHCSSSDCDSSMQPIGGSSGKFANTAADSKHAPATALVAVEADVSPKCHLG